MFFRKKKVESSPIGKIIDLPFEKFKNEIEKQKVNVGTMNNIILYLNGAYADLRTRKDALMKRLEEETLTDKDSKKIKKAIKSIYAELVKIEAKAVYLSERSKELSNVN